MSRGEPEKNRWERLKDWYSRHKAYIEPIIFFIGAGLVIVTLIYFNNLELSDDQNIKQVAFQIYSSIDIEQKMPISQAFSSYSDDMIFFNLTDCITGGDLLLHEGRFIKKMEALFSYYAQNSSIESHIRVSIGLLENFMKNYLALSPDGPHEKFRTIEKITETMLIYEQNLADAEQADSRFKIIYNFFTQNPDNGRHKLYINAYNKIIEDFTTVK